VLCAAPLLDTVGPQVVVAEAAPVYDGHSMARELADARVRTTLIADSAVFAMMARANKVRLDV
jgi:translation initiation factor eIF-2B subunit beta